MRNFDSDAKFNKYQFRGFLGDQRRGDWASFVSHDQQNALVVNLRTGALVDTFTGDDAWHVAGLAVVDNHNADTGWNPGS